MSAHCRVYKSMLWLYPRDFRRHYRSDLVQSFNDLLDEHGVRAAWTRASIDLVVTVPRYRLESIMSEHSSTTTINTALIVLSVGGSISLFTGFYPFAVLFWIAAILLAFVQRDALARAIRTPSTNRRRNRLGRATVLAATFVAAVFSYLVDLNDNQISTASLLIHNAIGNTAMIGAVIYFILGLFTPRETRTTQNA